MSSEPTFREFQDLPEFVLEGVLIIQETKDDGKGAEHVIASFADYQGDYKIGDLIYCMDLIASAKESALNSMFRCWMDHDKDMLRAKLAWTPSY